ncbi:MAG: hypothetical protein ACSW8I_10345 [bacterium]
MKTRFFFAAFMLLAVTGMQAQLNSLITDASPTFTNPTGTNIVRNYNNQFAVGFLKDNANSYFYSNMIEAFSAPSTMPLTVGRKLQVDSGWVINDIKIFGEYTFFCGRDGITNGIIGWFHTNDIWTGGMVYVTKLDITIPVSLLNLKKMAVINTPTGAINVVLIAEGMPPIQKDYIVEVRDVLGSSPVSYSYTTLPAISSTQKQTLHDVLVMNNKVFFIGMDTRSSYNTFFIRKASSTNVFGDPSLSQVYYYNPVGTSTVIPQIKPCAEAVGGSRIAVAHQIHGGNVSGVSTVVSYIDTSAMNCVYAHVQHNGNRWNLLEMKYIASTNSLILLSDQSVSSTFSVFHPAITIPYSFCQIPSDDQYTSLDLLNNQSFLSAGGCKWFLQRTTSSSLPTPCITPTELQVGISSYSKTVETQVLIPDYTSNNSLPNFKPVSAIAIILPCQY